MRLPVIQTCGGCGHYRLNGARFSCMRAGWSAIGRDTDSDKPQPSWCPLRTGPDEAELEALLAVAEAVEALLAVAEAAEALMISGVCRAMETPEEWAAHGRLEAALDALRRLDEVRRG